MAVFYALTDAPESPVPDSQTVVMINGRAFEPSFIDQGQDGRMIVVVEQEDLYAGENTVEIHWGDKPPATLTAELPEDTKKVTEVEKY
jgi:hypothetical protein